MRFKHLFSESRKPNLKLREDGNCPNFLTQFIFVFRLYEALAFLSRADVLSSDFTTPLAAPPLAGSFL